MTIKKSRTVHSTAHLGVIKRGTAALLLSLGMTFTAQTAQAHAVHAASDYNNPFTPQAFEYDDLYFGNSATRIIYIGDYEVDVDMFSLTDNPFDTACTGAWAALHGRDGRQLGNWIPLGSACGNRTVDLPAKRITTRAGAIHSVSIFVGYVGQATCWRTADYYRNC